MMEEKQETERIDYYTMPYLQDLVQHGNECRLSGPIQKRMSHECV